jgi:hypothetical protein
MDLDGANQEDLHTAKSVISGCQRMFAFPFFSVLVCIIPCGALLKYLVYLILIVFIFLGKLTSKAELRLLHAFCCGHPQCAYFWGRARHPDSPQNV